MSEEITAQKHGYDPVTLGDELETYAHAIRNCGGNNAELVIVNAVSTELERIGQALKGFHAPVTARGDEDVPVPKKRGRKPKAAADVAAVTLALTSPGGGGT